MRGLALSVFLIFGLILSGNADPLLEACGRDDGKTISACRKTCSAACRDSKFADRTQAILTACRAVMSQPESGRLDHPECAKLLALPRDACDTYVSSYGDDDIPESGSRPPECLRSFPHLQCRFEQIGQRVAALDARFKPMVDRYRPLLEQVRPNQDPDEIEKFLCAVNLKDMAADYRTSESLNSDVKKITEDFDEQSRCLVKIQEWIKNYKVTSSLDIGTVGQGIITGFLRRIEKPMKMQSVVQKLITDVKQSRSVIIDTYTLHRAVCGPAPH